MSNQQQHILNEQQVTDHDEAKITYPAHISEQPDGKKLWIINGYRVWAQDYDQALVLAAMIDTF